MSQKSLDRRGRWRSMTIAFRVSPEENENINRRVKLSGLTKQDYILRRLEEQDIVVVGNPRVYKALKGQMELILTELRCIAQGEPIDADLQETIRFVTGIFGGMGQE